MERILIPNTTQQGEWRREATQEKTTLSTTTNLLIRLRMHPRIGRQEVLRIKIGEEDPRREYPSAWESNRPWETLLMRRYRRRSRTRQ